MKKLVLLPVLFALAACGEETPCDRLNLCCDALILETDEYICGREVFPSTDDACQAQLEAVADFLAEDTPLPSDCATE